MFEDLSKDEIVAALEEVARDDDGIFYDYVELNEIACELYFIVHKLINGDMSSTNAKLILNLMRKQLALCSYDFCDKEKEELETV